MAEQDIVTDVLVIGAGSAALCAATAAVEQGSSVTVLEKAPKKERGGNSALTVTMRFVCKSLDEMLELAPPGMDDSAKQAIENRFKPIDEAGYWDEIMHVTNGRSDPDMAKRLVNESRSVMLWMKSRGHYVVPNVEPTSHNPIMMEGRGKGMQERNFEYLEKQGVRFMYDSCALELTQDAKGQVTGAVMATNGQSRRVMAKATILGCGGFEGNASMRASYLGPGWDAVAMRGVPFNTGDGLRMATDIGADTHGSWSSCHASPQDFSRPKFGLPSREVVERDGDWNWSRYSYPFGIMVNAEGNRFADEAPDVRARTYAQMGRHIVAQPGGLAYQIFDSRIRKWGLITEEYESSTFHVVGESIAELAEKAGIPKDTLVQTVEDFNNAVPSGESIPSQVRTDGRCTTGITPKKSNYAMAISAPPFEAFKVGCGITFTFGGLRIDPATSSVMHVGGWRIPGLYACGEMVGGLFYGNYSGGSGLTGGAVFGRTAGSEAASYVPV